MGDIIKKEGIALQYIGKIDKDKLGKYKIATDIVIITKERIEHIRKRHSKDYEKYIQYIPDIIKEPDYILKDKNNVDTILVLKTIADTNIQIVIKLHTNKDENKYNTVLTFWQIREKNYKKTVQRNKIINE